MSDLIDRQAAIDAADRADYTGLAVEDVKKVTDEVVKEIKKLPSAQTEQKKGKWIERKAFDTKGSGIEEMQSAKCSACGKYHTTPYLYFFDNFNFCPNCGADMRGERNG